MMPCGCKFIFKFISFNVDTLNAIPVRMIFMIVIGIDDESANSDWSEKIKIKLRTDMSICTVCWFIIDRKYNYVSFRNFSNK